MLLKSYLINKYFPVTLDQVRKRSLRWVERGEVLKILFDASQIKEVIKIRERFWSRGIVVKLICVTKENKLYTDVLNVSEKGWIYSKIKSVRALSDAMPKKGVLLSLYKKDYYVVNHLITIDDSIVKIGVNVANPELFDLSFKSDTNKDLAQVLESLITLIKTIEIR